MIDDPSLPALINQSRHSLHPSHIAADHVGFNLIEWGQTYLPSRLKWKIDRAIGCNTSLENLECISGSADHPTLLQVGDKVCHMSKIG